MLAVDSSRSVQTIGKLSFKGNKVNEYQRLNEKYLNKLRKQHMSKEAYEAMKFNQFMSSVIGKLAKLGFMKK